MGPVGLGTVALLVLARSDRTAAWFVRDFTPVPDKLTCCGLSVLLSLMDTSPVKEPRAPGVNVTVTVHEPPAATLVPQLFV